MSKAEEELFSALATAQGSDEGSPLVLGDDEDIVDDAPIAEEVVSVVRCSEWTRCRRIAVKSGPCSDGDVERCGGDRKDASSRADEFRWRPMEDVADAAKDAGALVERSEDACADCGRGLAIGFLAVVGDRSSNDFQAVSLSGGPCCCC